MASSLAHIYWLPECENEWVAILVPSVELFSFCLFCPALMCQDLLYLVIILYYLVETYLFSKKRHKGNGIQMGGEIGGNQEV